VVQTGEIGGGNNIDKILGSVPSMSMGRQVSINPILSRQSNLLETPSKASEEASKSIYCEGDGFETCYLGFCGYE
jgi:hypothetical protein